MTMKQQLPFGMQKLDTVTHDERGYELSQTSWDYNPATQTTNQLLMGSSEPTTYSSVGSTGVISTDTDEGADDTGTD